MEVREHRSQHEATTELPLLTESATVTTVEALDRSRNDAVVRGLRELLDEWGSATWEDERPPTESARRRWIRDHLDPIDEGTPLNEYLPKAAHDGRTGKRLKALQERYLRPYPSLLKIVVETDEPVDFVAGQYIGVRYRGTTRVYSIASSPNRDELEFCIRRVPGGRLTPSLSVDLDEGDQVALRGPYGDFVMEKPSTRDLAFLATGTGVAPFRSMIDYCFEEGRDEVSGTERDVWLFLGCAWEDDLPYREHFRELERTHENFHFVPTLSREPCLSEWDGETAYVQHVLAKYVADDALAETTLPDAFDDVLNEAPRVSIDARLDPERLEVYACGINAMVHSLVDAVEQLDVPEEHTQFEGFG